MPPQLRPGVINFVLNGVDFRDNTPWGLRLIQKKDLPQFKQILSIPAVGCAEVKIVAIPFLWSPSWLHILRKSELWSARARARLPFSVPEELCPQQSSFLLRAVYRLQHHHDSAPLMAW